ncbi:hypothetical protein H6G41_34335 [Tolypothrix sp. FACHB-123]|uniref:hypothetical protein n=1 Tax=Tolypothrix sp. FACHB-123 TaxID=2692868 RepID=UPI0016856EC5|nr:hypothetical protein [Tolypothrix sp. FACHB-123]MBD2359560.1 hypothetical protein [Tolypothrix sp. FACHB-123]
MTITATRKAKKPAKEKPQSPYKRLHVIIPIEDMLWAQEQKPSVSQLWQECWTSDPYGSRWMPLSTALGYSTFICVKKILCESGLFIFKPDKSIQDGRETVGWMVRNLHGSRMKEFWEKVNAQTQQANSTKQQSNAESTEKKAGSEEMRCKYAASISDKTEPGQGFYEPSRTVQEHLTNSSVEFVRCSSSTQNKNLHCEETAIAPFGGASPQPVECVEEEKEELPKKNTCVRSQNSELNSVRLVDESWFKAPDFKTLEDSLTLVDEVPTQSASLIEEKQNLGVEAIVPHEDTNSAAPAASSFENLVTQSREPAPASIETSLVVENETLGNEDKTDREGTGCASFSPESEKWSNEAIAQRSKARPWRMEKLKLAEVLKENPGFEFLRECWEDDPALQIVIKGLLRKFPQWSYVAVDGVLVEWKE